MKPKISIVTPSFNQGKFIEETICSVLDQGYSNLEYIIIDGGSTDNSVEIIKKYERHLKHWVSEPDQGQSHAINKGLQYCTGEIFNWLNSDDLLLPEALATISTTFIEDNNVQIVSGKELYFSAKDSIYKYGTKCYNQIEQNVFHPVFYQPSTYWRMDTFRTVKIEKRLHFLMDTHIWIQFLLKYGTSGFQKIDKALVKFRLHEDSKSMSLKKQFRKERWTLRKKLMNQLGVPLHPDESVLALSNPIRLADFDIQVEVSKDEIQRLYNLELFNEAYQGFNYPLSRELLKEIVSDFTFMEKMKWQLKLSILPYLGFLRTSK